MSLSVAFQMNHIASIDTKTDSTFILALEAQKRGHILYHYQPTDLSLEQGSLSAVVQRMHVQQNSSKHYTLSSSEKIELKTVDIILMRQDPPFNMEYITATHLLEHLQPDVLVVNDPASVRNCPEKIFVTLFGDLMPPTLITSNRQDIESFREEYRDIIIKPLYGNGGFGVIYLRYGDENFSSVLEIFSEMYREPIMVQQFLPEVRNGDKRIILLEGRPIGAINRIPAEGEVRANMHVGGTPTKTIITENEQAICQAIGPMLKDRGLVLVGIDIIDNKYLTEINVTSPTGIQEINLLNNTSLETEIWDTIEAKYLKKADGPS